MELWIEILLKIKGGKRGKNVEGFRNELRMHVDEQVRYNYTTNIMQVGGDFRWRSGG